MKTYRKDVHATLNGRAITISVAVTAEEEDRRVIGMVEELGDFVTGGSLSAAHWLMGLTILHTRGPVEVPDA